MKEKNKILENVFWLLACLVIVLFLLSKFYPDFKYGLYIVKSGSMEPEISVGSIIVSKKQVKYRLRDIITFRKNSQTITHRIVGGTREGGDIKYKTKGEANEESDIFLVDKKNVLGKVVLNIPYLGYLFIFMKTNLGMSIFLGIPAILIIFYEIKDLKSKKD